MSRDSLFSRHLEIITDNPSTWGEAERKENEDLQSLRLPPLAVRKQSWWKQFQFQIQLGVGAACTASIAIVLFLPRSPTPDLLTAKGAVQVSAYWARGTAVSPLTGDENLMDGDKVGVGLISNEESVAFWAITDSQFKLLSPATDIESSRLSLEPGIKKSFDSSFELTAPNQGEHLVVIVCPKAISETSAPAVGALMDQNFIARLIAAKKVHASDCIFAGYRLRKMQ